MWKEKTKKQKFFLKALVVSFAVWPFFAGLVACKKNGGDDAPPPPPPVVVGPYGNCPNCFAASSALLTGVNALSVAGDLSGVFDMIASPSTTGFNLANPKAILYYSGPFQLIGTMTVSAASDFRYCGVVPGQYMIHPISNGWISMGAMATGGRIVGESPVGRFTAVVGGGVVTNGTSSMGVVRGDPGNRLYMTLRFESVNGQPCRYGYYSMGISFF